MDKQTIDTYNKLAKEYDKETAGFWEEFPRTFLDEFIKLSGKKTLDVGSGPGRDGLLLQKGGKEVVCLDASVEMVKLSSDKGLESIVGDFNNLPFEDSSFDSVWAYTSLLHVPKNSITTPLKEMDRVLVPAGILALGFIEGDTELYRESAGVDLPRWFSFYKKEEVVSLLEKNGFKLIYFETFKPRSRNYLNFIFQKQN